MKHQVRGFVVNEWFLAQSEIKRFIRREGMVGLGRLIEIALHLLRCDNTIGMMDDLVDTASDSCTRTSTLKKMVEECGLFDCQERDGKFFFVFKLLRKMLGLNLTITEEELDFVAENGNRTKELSKRSREKKNDKDDDDSTKYNKNKPKKQQEIYDKTSLSKLLECQSIDNKDVMPFPISDNDSNVHYITESNGNDNEHTTTSVSKVDSSAAAGAEDKSFNFLEKKLIPCIQWRKSTSKTRCINLEDDKTLHIFAEWMENYCISNNTMPSSLDEIMHYASCLLAKKNHTRRDFDKYLADALGIKPESKKKQTVAEAPACGPIHIRTRGTFEQLINGKRIGLEGQELPLDAPKLYNEDDRWSYKLHKYVKKWEWNKDEEMRTWEAMKHQALLDELARRKEVAKKLKHEREKIEGIQSVGEIIVNDILPNMKHESNVLTNANPL